MTILASWRRGGVALLLLLTCLFAPWPVLAIITATTEAQCTAWGIICTGSGATDLDKIIDYIWRAVQVVFGMLATIAAAALVYYGVLYIISTGEEEEARRAKKGIVYAILGMMVVGLAAWIVNAVINL